MKKYNLNSLVDYTGKLNNHEDYIKILNELKKQCSYIEIVILDERSSNVMVDYLKDDIISVTIVSEWWQTKTTAKDKLFKIKASKKLFDYLYSLKTFCIYSIFDDNKEYFELTDFGYDDIAFFDKNDSILLCTTTHEGYISIREDLINNNFNL